MKNGERGLVLHLGIPRTGTTTLQHALFRSHPGVFYMGKDLGSEHPRWCVSPEVHLLLEPMIWDTSKRLKVRRHRALLRKTILRGVDAERRIVASWEGLSLSTPEVNVERMRRLTSVFSSLKIVIVLRNPLTQLPSLYLEHLEGQYLRKPKSWLGASLYVDPGVWLESMVGFRGSLRNVVPHLATVREAVDLLGRENVGVFVFEDLVRDPDDFYTRLSGFVGIDASMTLEKVRGEHHNKGLTRGQVEFLKRLDASPGEWSKLKLERKCIRQRTLRQVRTDDVPARIRMPSSWEEKISEETREGHRWIQEHFAVSLRDHGYPV